ncbi:MAG: putative carbohydrate kinase [Parcubacteria group bacterium Athens0714_16]|nr:MAG: putative carbohydrate kinase [Parcubacteria group bacterium Athens0714_16]
MKKILVIGESCRDIFVYCKAERLAPDLPIPVLNIIEQKENPGMAANVERNIRGIFSNVDLYTNEKWQEVTKTRYIHRDTNHIFIRVDTDHHIPRVKVESILLSKYDIIAISDYNKGFLHEEDMAYIFEHHNNVFIDTKKILGDWAVKAKFIKINNYEYERSKPYISSEVADKIIHTKGEHGSIFKGKIYPVAQKVEVKDTSGAGDSFFAALVVKYAETESIESAIAFANECASQVVRHKGVSVIEKD